MKKVEILDVIKNCGKDIDLEISESDINKTFEDIGIDSFVYIQLLVSLEEQLGIEFLDEMLDLSYFSSISQLADYILTYKRNI